MDPQAQHPHRKSPHRVLVADDNRDGADSLVMMLSLYGYEADAAYDGEQAVEKARSFEPDVVILDLDMPVMSGYEAARALKEADEPKPALVVALTAADTPEAREKAGEAGFDVHLTKPAEAGELVQLIEGAAKPERDLPA